MQSLPTSAVMSHIERCCYRSQPPNTTEAKNNCFQTHSHQDNSNKAKQSYLQGLLHKERVETTMKEK